MRRFVALVLLLAWACAPAVTAPIPSPPLVTAAPTLAPTSASPSAPATAAPSPTASATPAPTASAPPATPAPTAPPPTAAPIASPIHNDGQVIVAELSPGHSTFVGEAGPGPAVLIGTHWKINGTVLAGADIRCIKRTATPGQDLCIAVRMITDKVRLRNGTAYELVLDSDVIGSFVASGITAATPHVVSLKATQYDLIVQFDRPMLHTGDCGLGPVWSFGTPGTMEHVRGAGTFPAPLGSYTSSSASYGVFLSAFVSEANLSPDCTTVKFGSGWGGPTGRFDITVSGVQDIDGNLVQPRTFTVDVQDEGAPRLMFAQLELQTAEKKVIRVAYSEAMDEDYVTDAERYFLNGKPIPAGTTIECELAGCTWVRLTFPPTAFTYGADNVLSIVAVRDLAGNVIAPNIATSGTFQVR
jgi:hypothetical protein